MWITETSMLTRTFLMTHKTTCALRTQLFTPKNSFRIILFHFVFVVCWTYNLRHTRIILLTTEFSELHGFERAPGPVFLSVCVSMFGRGKHVYVAISYIHWTMTWFVLLIFIQKLTAKCMIYLVWQMYSNPHTKVCVSCLWMWHAFSLLDVWTCFAGIIHHKLSCDMCTAWPRRWHVFTYRSNA